MKNLRALDEETSTQFNDRIRVIVAVNVDAEYVLRLEIDKAYYADISMDEAADLRDVIQNLIDYAKRESE